MKFVDEIRPVFMSGRCSPFGKKKAWEHATIQDAQAAAMLQRMGATLEQIGRTLRPSAPMSRSRVGQLLALYVEHCDQQSMPDPITHEEARVLGACFHGLFLEKNQ